MPPGRTARHRILTNENDENVAGSMRMTRAQSKALGLDDAPGAGIAKKPLQSKKTTSTTRTATSRRRAALGDVSNVGKTDGHDGKEGKDVKHATRTRGTTTKAGHAGGVQKLSRNASRSALGSKDTNKKVAHSDLKEKDLKRPLSGSGAIGGAMKKRNTKSAHASTKSKTKVEPKQRQLEEEEVEVEEDEDEVAEPVVKSERHTKQAVYVQLEQRVAIEVQSESEEGDNEEEVEQEDIKTLLDAEVPDLDAEDLGDPLMVADYVGEIFDYMHKLEIDTMPNANYMDHQEDIEWKMRGILVDWLIEVHTRFHLLPETLYLAVNIIDRFLSNKACQLDRLQLVGVTAMFIASKYEEVLSPVVANFRHVTDNGFSDEEIRCAERFVLQTLNYDLSYPNPMNFLRRISKADRYDIQTRTLAKYLLEISVVDHRFIQFPPSHVAAAAMYFARLILERGPWDATLAHYSNYTEDEILPVFRLMIDYVRRPVAHEALFKKYASKRFLKVSLLIRQWAKKHASEHLNVPLCQEEVDLLSDFQ